MILAVSFLVQNDGKCILGDRCNYRTRGIGLTLDDILRNDIEQNTPLNNQSFLIKIGAALTMIIFAGGLINSLLSLLTFLNVELRKVGCGIYLLSSSITSFLTISLLTIKFWFVVLSQMLASVSFSAFHGGCVSIEPLLKLFLYVDTWFNACVAVERAVSVSKGVKFNRKRSKRIARGIIIILPLFVMITIIHEPINRATLEYTAEKYNVRVDENWTNDSLIYENWTNVSMGYETETQVLCVISYSSSVQNYNTAILFFHLVMPFITNLLSALYIIFGTARRRSATRNKQTYKQHILEQFNNHKQLVISPIIVLILSLPRLIISLMPGCVDTSRHPWLYLGGYFLSFTPSILVFTVFVLPSELYMKVFKESLRKWRGQRTHQ